MYCYFEFTRDPRTSPTLCYRARRTPTPERRSRLSDESQLIDRLLASLSLTPLDRDLYLADPGPGSGRLFGGLVAAQSVSAACLTLDGADPPALHSLHAYFLRPGRYASPIRFVVDRIRDGRTFTTRRVVAHQNGEAIFNLSASFARPEEGLSHQAPMPEAPPPEGLPSWADLRNRANGRTPGRDRNPIDVRVCDPSEFEGDAERSHTRMVWLRMKAKLPDDPIAHTAALVFASDRTLLSTALRPAKIVPGSRYTGASLDHAMWIHHPARFDDWILYCSNSPVAHAARGLIHGAMFTRDGIQIASTTQEGLIRLPRD
jgi:acyl-CoA thioesterase-2